jgi:hypothetical protein
MKSIAWYVDSKSSISLLLSPFIQKVSTEHGKNFNFFKQHYISHIIEDIRRKGTTDNMSTRPGEGFQQEAAEAYEQSNKKQAEKQVRSLLITHSIFGPHFGS